MILEQFTKHPYWNGKLYIPFIKEEKETRILKDELQFMHHGLIYSIKLDQEIRVKPDGAVFVKLTSKKQVRTNRRAIGLPSNMYIYFSGKKHGVLLPRDIELFKEWVGLVKPMSIQQAFQQAQAAV